MSQVRWLTCADRIFCIDVSIEVPSENLTILATYIIKVYALTWFFFKTHPTCKNVARHLWKLIYASRYLLTELIANIDSVIQRNIYFAQPENLFLAMLTDPQKHIPELAARRILKTRSIKTNRVRLFKLPDINFNALYYIDLIDWQDIVPEPPILKTILDEDIQ